MIKMLVISVFLTVGLGGCTVVHQPKPDKSEERLDVGPEAPIPSSRR